MSIEETREAARCALVEEYMTEEADRLAERWTNGSLTARLDAARRAIRRGIDHQIETPAMLALCRLYVAEHEEADHG